MPKLVHPYAQLDRCRPLRGNLHAHTVESDGELEPQTLVDLYASSGYDFLAISDHDVFSGPKELARLDSRGMVLIPANEISKQGIHLQHVDADRLVAPDPDRQRVIDEINAGSGFAIVNHPNWQAAFDYCPQALLDQWSGYAGLEIYNAVIGRLKGSPYATNKWDQLLSQGRRVWGFANDDFHIRGDGPQGWNVAFAESRRKEAIVSALRHGRFYASTGVVVSRIAAEGMKISVETENADRMIAIADGGRRIKVVDARAIELEAPKEGCGYIRIECLGRGEQAAWTQPFFVES